MEPLLFSVCVIVLTLLFFFSACSSQAKSHGKRNGKLKLPPGSLGWPFIGETYDFLFSDPHQFIKLRMQKYSPKIFKTNLHGQPTAVLCGTSGHKFIAANEEKLMTAWRTTAMQKLFRGKDRTNSSDGATISRRSEKHVIRAPVLISQEALVAYASIIDGMTKKHFERKWFGKSEVEVYGLIELLTVGIATKLFIGLESDVERLAKMAKWFGHIAHGLNVLPYDIPGTKFGRAMKSAKAVKHEILKVMEEKRERICKGEKPSDILSFLMLLTLPPSL
ncbi:beta-amyrin 28-monooxygenase-like [Neltuma alba]|uniref:beta-amyrin 28-monooxygenase-like n=1 Tax=Neltuma alba TaxID=207710 RepID=UPI0010A393EE|nr:beta-amyrin 28-monooxygenase-like [Prosopis alba]